ncbi:uncharacterized protein LOC110114252 [Dendrobium catenatum]|nr:uncharacterized protein LOC110114252 [Dendrobium catenatum]
MSSHKRLKEMARYGFDDLSLMLLRRFKNGGGFQYLLNILLLDITISVFVPSIRTALLHSKSRHKEILLTGNKGPQQLIFWKRREVKYLKQSSLWSSSFDSAISLLVRSSFTILARIKQVFGIPQIIPYNSSFISATVHPETPPPAATTPGSIITTSTAALTPPPTTVGAASLAPHYAKLIVVVERMMQAPRARADVRDEMYGMMTARLRAMVRSRLIGMGRGPPRDGRLASEWRAAMREIMEWLGPVAHGTLRWHGERSYERRSAGAVVKENVLVLQTLYFANMEKVEAAIVELLVGMNYVWRFEMEAGL